MVVELAHQIERGALEGPRIIAAARGITITGGHGMEVGRIADGADNVRAATREQVAAGATVIKLFSTGGVLGEGAGPELAAYTPEETRAAVDEAHRAGIRITTHAHGATGMRIAAEAGIDSIEHATLLDRETIRIIKEKDVALVPTFSALRRILGNDGALPARVVERARLVASKHQEGVRAAHKAGVRIAAGTDAGTPFNTHERFALELVYLSEAGLSPSQALVAATSLAADVVGRPKAGRIAVGSWADLLFVDGDPLRDLTVLQKPKAVWVRGAPLA
jgi:imidazolonepropionase-like amidohydrolase